MRSVACRQCTVFIRETQQMSQAKESFSQVSTRYVGVGFTAKLGTCKLLACAGRLLSFAILQAADNPIPFGAANITAVKFRQHTQKAITQ